MDDWMWLLLSVIVAISASSVTYFYSVRVTRKSRLYDARLKLYGDYIGLYQEALGSLERIMHMQEMDLSKEALSDETHSLSCMMILLSELTYAGDSESASLVCDPQSFVASVEEQGEAQFLENLRTRAIMLHTRTMLRHFTDIRFRAGQLALITEIPLIVSCINDVNNVLAAGFGKLLANTASKYPELFEKTGFGEGLTDKATSREEWAKHVSFVLEGLLVNMQMELKRTL